MGDIFIWWLLATVIGLAALPISLKTFQFLPDRGYAFSKALGLILIGILTWLIGFISISSVTILLTLVGLAAYSYWLWVNYQKELIEFFKEKAGYILVTELFFLCLYLLFVFFRMNNPDIIGTEKFMDLAFMNSLSRATSFPPYDPWLAGSAFSISYYYLGYFLMSIFVRLGQTAPAIGFTLALSMLYALAGITIFGLFYNMTRRLRWAFGGWALLFLIGNLDGFKQVLTTRTIENFNWWTPSRVIPDTINEFPFFSFLLGDMHPHMLSIPYVAMGMGFGLNHLRSNERDLSLRDSAWLGRLLIWGLLIGALGFMNSWDLPMIFFIAVLAIFLQQYAQRPNFQGWPWKNLLLSLGVMLGMMILPYIPFYLTFHSQAKGIQWTTQNTRISDFFVIFGFYLFLLISFVAARFHHWFVTLLTTPPAAGSVPEKKRARFCPQCGVKLREEKMICGQCGHQAVGRELQQESEACNRPMSDVPGWFRNFLLFLIQPVAFLKQGGSKQSLWLLVAAVGLAGAAMGLKLFFFSSAANPLPVLLGILLLGIMTLAVLLLARVDKPETVFALLLAMTAGMVLMGCEILHIKDTFNPPLDRMNTVFKFYYQAWFLLGISGIYGVYWMFQHSMRNANLRLAWAMPVVILIAASLVYPYASIMIKTNHFYNIPSLDGSTYLNNSYLADRVGIEWLRKSVKGNPVILEATGAEYTDFARVSTFTGLPTVLGWAGHELQWRGNYDEPSRRIPAIDTLYSSMDLEETKKLLDFYNVSLVFVGTLERQKYPEGALAKFSMFMDKIFEHPGGVAIYKKR